MPDPSVDKYRGALLGAFLGDVVGSPANALNAREILQFLHRKVFTRDFEDVTWAHGGGKFPFGQISYRAQMLKLLGDNLLQQQGLVVPSIRETFKESLPRLVGMDVLDRLALQTKPSTLPQAEGVLGGIVVGLVFESRSAGVLRNASMSQASVTHADLLVMGGAVAVSVAVALALSATSIDQEFFDSVAGVVQRCHLGLGQAVRALGERLADPWEDVLVWVKSFDPFEVGGISGHVTSTLLWSFYVFANHPSDVMAALVAMLRPGGSIRTGAMITAALVGARSGAVSFPLYLTGKMMDAGVPLKEPLVLLAESLFRKQGRISEAMIRTK